MLSEVAGGLRPGGRFALDLNSADAIMRRFRPASVEERGDSLVIDRRSSDPLTGRMVTERTVVRNCGTGCWPPASAA